MRHNYIETETVGLGASLEFEGDPFADADPRYEALVRTFRAAEIALEELGKKAAKGESYPDPQYILVLQEAYYTGLRVVNNYGEYTLKHEFDSIDDADVTELRATVGYVAPHFGVDIEWMSAMDEAEACS